MNTRRFARTLWQAFPDERAGVVAMYVSNKPSHILYRAIVRCVRAIFRSFR